MNTTSFFKQKMDFSDKSIQIECFRLFDKDGKDYLDEEDFDNLTKCVLNNLQLTFISDLFHNFDRNKDNKIDKDEFEIVWSKWVKPLVQPVTALLIIDVQNDFISGSLALKNCPAKQDGKEIIPIINQLTDNVDFDFVVYSIDCHPEEHISFFENVKNHKLSNNSKQKVEDVKLFDTVTFTGSPEMKQIMWPKHCVRQTWGCKLHEDLNIRNDWIQVKKGTNPLIDSYSAFGDNMKVSQTELHEKLQERQVTHVFVCGLALDYCVSFTALDALELGYCTVLVEDATRGTDTNNIETMKRKLRSNLCVMAPSEDIENLVNGKSIRLEFAKVLGKCVGGI